MSEADFDGMALKELIGGIVVSVEDQTDEFNGEPYTFPYAIIIEKGGKRYTISPQNWLAIEQSEDIDYDGWGLEIESKTS